MPEKNFVKSFRTAKIFQFCTLLLLEIEFFVILFCNPSLTKELYSNMPLSILCVVTWILMLFNLFCLLYDFLKLRSIAEETHALNRAAYLDNLTSIPNRHGLEVIFRTFDNPESLANVGCFMVTIENLREINNTLGRHTGDIVIQHFSSIFESVGDHFGIVGRNGGNDFLMIIKDCTEDTMRLFINSLNERIEESNREPGNTPIRIRYTYVLNAQEKATIFTQLLTSTYNKLHA